MEVFSDKVLGIIRKKTWNTLLYCLTLVGRNTGYVVDASMSLFKDLVDYMLTF